MHFISIVTTNRLWFWKQTVFLRFTSICLLKGLLVVHQCHCLYLSIFDSTVRVIWVRVTGCINHMSRDKIKKEFLEIFCGWAKPHSFKGRLLELPQSSVPDCSCLERADNCEYRSLAIHDQTTQALWSNTIWLVMTITSQLDVSGLVSWMKVT